MDQHITELNIGFQYPEIFQPFLEPHRYKVAEGGRGGAKSHFFANMVVHNVFLYGKRVLCCREVQLSIKESVKQLIQDKIETQGLSEYFIIKDTEILCRANDGKISFAGLRQQGQTRSAADNLKSYEGYDICWIEEAQTVSKMSLDLILPTIRKQKSEFWFSYNRKHKDEPVHNRFVDSEYIPQDTVHIYVNWWDNPWFKDSPLYPLMLSDKANNVDDYRHIWCGLPAEISEASIFTNWEVREFETPPFVQFKFGADWGFSPDPCVLLRSFADWNKMELYIDYSVFKTGLDPVQIVRELFSTIPEAKANKTIADSARPEIISLLNKNGYRTVGAKKGPGSIEAGCDWLKQWRIIIHPRCQKKKNDKEKEDIVDEFKKYSRKVDRATGVVLPDIVDQYNHAIDALRYAWEKEIRQKNTLDYVKLMKQANKEKEEIRLQEVPKFVRLTKQDIVLPSGKIMR